MKRNVLIIALGLVLGLAFTLRQSDCNVCKYRLVLTNGDVKPFDTITINGNYIYGWDIHPNYKSHRVYEASEVAEIRSAYDSINLAAFGH